MNRKKYQKITEERFVEVINEEYQNAKKTLNPLLSSWHRSAVKFLWKKKMGNIGGSCYKFSRTIALNSKYKESQEMRWDLDCFRRTVRHEIAHLVYSGHGGMFKRALELLGGSRFQGQPAYQKPEPNKNI